MNDLRAALIGGTVLDPANGVQEEVDVAVYSTHVSCGPVGDVGVPPHAKINVSGMLVLPGLIDAHVHVFKGGGPLGIDADEVGISSGVTTVVDTGSSGALNFNLFRDTTIAMAHTAVVPFLNYGITGITSPQLAELDGSNRIDATLTERVVNENRSLIKGLKVRATRANTGSLGILPISQAKDCAVRLGLPLLVHIGEPRTHDDVQPLTPQVLELLGEGDIVTHTYTARNGGLLDESGEVLPEAWAAKHRGVLFDVGHGLNNTSFDVFRRLSDQHFFVDAISSDVHLRNRYAVVYDLLTTMSKFIGLGMSLEDVVRLTTVGPARIFGLGSDVGGLGEKFRADLTVVARQPGPYEFHDSEGEVLRLSEVLAPTLVVKSGVLRPTLPRPYLPVA